LSRDPAWKGTEDSSAFSYVKNNPVSFTDSQGLFIDSVCQVDSVSSWINKCFKHIKGGEFNEFCDCVCAPFPPDCEKTCRKCKDDVKKYKTPKAGCYCFCTEFGKLPAEKCAKRCDWSPPKKKE
jgi:hypothetical protein